MMVNMKPLLKGILKALKWIFGVAGLVWLLVILLLIFPDRAFIVYEPNVSWLMFEIVLLGFGLILQFIPLKD